MAACIKHYYVARAMDGCKHMNGCYFVKGSLVSLKHSPTQYLCPWATPENCLTLKWSQVTTGCTVELDWHYLCPLGVCTGTTGSHGSAAASAENSAFISYNTYKTLVLSVGRLTVGLLTKLGMGREGNWCWEILLPLPTWQQDEHKLSMCMSAASYQDIVSTGELYLEKDCCRWWIRISLEETGAGRSMWCH